VSFFLLLDPEIIIKKIAQKTLEVHFNMQFTRDEMIAFSTTKSQMNSL